MSTPGETGTDITRLLHRGQQLLTPVSAGAEWLTPIRESGVRGVAVMPLPERKDEAWRYTPVSFLDQAEYKPLAAGPNDDLEIADIGELLLTDHDGDRLVFVNGYLTPALCRLGRASEGIALCSLAGGLGEVSARMRAHLGSIAEQRHVFSALNAALMSDGAMIHVPSGTSVEKPVEILHISVGGGDARISHPRHLIVLEDHARVEIIERYCSLGDDVACFNNITVEVALGAGSELVHARMQEENTNSQHLSDLQVRLDERSRYRLVLVALGGAWSRSDVRVSFEGEGAEAEMDGLMLAGDKQLNDVHLDIRHKVPHCTSRETFKGILDGRGRVVFDGRILVAPDAQKTDAQLSNDNLMLSRSAEVDTKPQLEIFADDVKCSHGTTVGELDSDMLFYLRSRGIPQAQATQMLCQGFAGVVLEQLPNEALRKHADELLVSRLNQVQM
jgi:Fe-S cluster assembly protein SufD